MIMEPENHKKVMQVKDDAEAIAWAAVDFINSEVRLRKQNRETTETLSRVVAGLLIGTMTRAFEPYNKVDSEILGLAIQVGYRAMDSAEGGAK